MLTWLASGLLASAAVLATRWTLMRVDSLGRARPFPIVSVVVLAAVGAGLFVPVVRHHRLETRLSDVASQLVGAPVVVHCQSAGQEFLDAGAELGYVRYGADGVPEHATLIKRAQCSDLAAYLHGGRSQPSRDEVVAVHVLSHEARHMAGTTTEARAECEAVQRDVWTAELLGASDQDARTLAGLYWRDVYPRMPDDYVSSDCRSGGALDEHRAGAPWQR